MPLDEDLPADLCDPELTGRRYMRVKVWEANWTEPMAQGIDFHEFYLHRGVNVWRLFNYRLGFFRPKIAYTGGVKIASEGETWVNASWVAPHFGQGYHPGVDASVAAARVVAPAPRRGPVPRRPAAAPPIPRRPAQRRTAQQDPGDDRRQHPPALDGPRRRARHPGVDVHPGAQAEDASCTRRGRSLWYHAYRKPAVLIATNEQEDLVVFKRERLNLEAPQKLGPLDVGLIYFRRHLAQRARDYQRLGVARGALKPLPRRAGDARTPAEGQVV